MLGVNTGGPETLFPAQKNSVKKSHGEISDMCVLFYFTAQTYFEIM